MLIGTSTNDFRTVNQCLGLDNAQKFLPFTGVININIPCIEEFPLVGIEDKFFRLTFSFYKYFNLPVMQTLIERAFPHAGYKV